MKLIIKEWLFLILLLFGTYCWKKVDSEKKRFFNDPAREGDDAWIYLEVLGFSFDYQKIRQKMQASMRKQEKKPNSKISQRRDMNLRVERSAWYLKVISECELLFYKYSVWDYYDLY